MTSSLVRLATVAASTKRAVATGAKRAAATTHLTGLFVTPLDPVDPTIRATLQLSTPHELLQTVINGSPDIVEGDLLVVGTNEYPIASVANNSNSSSGHGAYLRLILEDLKR